MAGEMTQDEVTRESYPLHFAVADAFDGTVRPFDVYQGPYILIGDDRVWITTPGWDSSGDYVCLWNERTRAESPAFLTGWNQELLDGLAILAAKDVCPGVCAHA